MLFAHAVSQSHLGDPVFSVHLLILGGDRREQTARGAEEPPPAVHTGTASPPAPNHHLPRDPELQINLLKGDNSSCAPRQKKPLPEDFLLHSLSVTLDKKTCCRVSRCKAFSSSQG